MTADNPKRLESGLGEQPFWFVPPKDIPDVLTNHDVVPVHLESGAHRLDLTLRMETRAADIDGRVNEDAPPLNLNMGNGRLLVGVLDGASSQRSISALDELGVKGAYYASHYVYLGFPSSKEYEDLTKKEDLTAGDVMRSMNDWLHENLSKVDGVDYNDPTTIPGVSSTLALIDAKMGKITIAHVADTLGLAQYDSGEIVQLTVDQNARFDNETLEYLQGVANQEGISLAKALVRKDVKELKRAQLRDSFKRKINTPNGCGILDGMPELVQNNLIYETEIPIAPDLRKLIIVSDGASLPYHKKGATPEDVNSALVADVDAFPVGNEYKFLDRVSQLLSLDPEYIEIPRLRDDDKTIQVVEFTNQPD